MSDRTNSFSLAALSGPHIWSGTIPNMIHRWLMLHSVGHDDTHNMSNLGTLFYVAKHPVLSSTLPERNSYRLNGYQRSHQARHFSDTFSGLHSTLSSSISPPLRAAWITDFSTNQPSITVYINDKNINTWIHTQCTLVSTLVHLEEFRTQGMCIQCKQGNYHDNLAHAIYRESSLACKGKVKSLAEINFYTNQ